MLCYNKMSSLLQQIKSLDINKQNTITIADSLSLDTLTTLDANVLGNATVGGDLLVKGIELDAKITNATSGKQDTLTPGTNITIDENNVISSSDGGSTIDSTTDLSCNTLDTVGDVNIGGNLSTPNRISFYATTDKELFVVNQGVVPQFNIIVKNIGNAYDNTTYQFTAPVAGTYFFGFSFYSDQNIAFVAEIQLNGSRISRAQRNPGYSSGYTKYHTSTTAFCSVGDVVRPISEANSIVIQTLNRTHFFGFLIG